ncbi:VOC family protein [Brucella cytisi]|uniref:Glyoxalase n=1 Tax=Brucella cytisi TaxID=407152 RepID=A0A1J6HBL3_9HYPH|nr:VOC family protein [Brucella cytisi]OIS90501.1 glyoxalase [Brucella cytisi]
MNLIAHVEIPVANLERAMRFYSAVFGVTFGHVVTIHGNRMAYFPFKEGKDGAGAVLAEGDAYVPTVHGAIIYFNVDEVDAVINKAAQEGREMLFPKTPVGNGFVAEIRDSEGNRIAIQTT